MWTDHTLKCPQDEDWLAVVRVTPDGDTTLLRYLGAVPDDAERELDAVQQRWIQRATWPRDSELQAGARIREYVKYPDDEVQP